MELLALLLAFLLTGYTADILPDIPVDLSTAVSTPAVPEPVAPEQVQPDLTPPADPETALPSASGALAGKSYCIDPGHGITSQHKQEAVSPLSSETKPAYVSGASGKQITEEALNLQVAFKLRDKLQSMGATVVMTRETNEASVSNIERAQIANQAGVNCCIRIHADGVDDSSVHGVSVLIPAGSLLGTPSIAEPSAALGKLMVNAVAEQTGAKNRGTVERRDMTGFTWSEANCVLLEMGFLSNPNEEANMIDPSYQDKIVEGIAQALVQWHAN